MLGLTKTRRQAGMWESDPSGKRRARLFAAHRYRKSGPRKTALTGLRKKTNDCRYIDDAGACTSRRRPAEEVRHPSKKSGGGQGEGKEGARKGHGKVTERARKGHGKSTERARRGHGKATKDRERVKRRPRAPQKGRLEGGGKEPAGGGNRLRCMDTKKPAPDEGAGTLLDRSQIRASRHCQPSHARGWRTHA